MSDIQDDSKSSKKNTLTKMLDLTLQFVNCYIDKNANLYVMTNDTNKVIAVDSDEFSQYVLRIYREEYNEVVNKDSVKNIIPHITDVAQSLPFSLHTRCNYYKDTVVIDLCDSRFIMISADKIGYNVKLSIPLLKQSKTMLPLPYPALDEQPKQLPSLIMKHFNVDERQSRLLTIWLCSAFVSSISIPLLVITGEKGSCKSSLAKGLKQLIDPTVDGATIIAKTERDMAIMMNSQYLLNIDNVSEGQISSVLSDLLSVSVTNGIYSTRKLYTDSTLTYMELNTRIILNGISDILLEKEDALDRSMILHLKRLPEFKMKSQRQLVAAFEHDKPLILGAIFNGIHQALGIWNDIQVTNISRLHDFVTFGCALAEVIGFGKERFLSDFKSIKKHINFQLLTSNPTAVCILTFMEDKTEWSGTPTELWNLCKVFAIDAGINAIDLPRSASTFSRKLMSLQSNLEKEGIFIKRCSGTNRKIILRKINRE